MTPGEIRAWNAAIDTMRGIASASADLIEATGRRPLVEAFAVASLRAMADDSAALLVPIEGKPDAAVAASPDPKALPVPPAVAAQ